MPTESVMRRNLFAEGFLRLSASFPGGGIQTTDEWSISVWDSKYLTGKFRKICVSEFSRPLQEKKEKQNLKKNTFSAGMKQKAQKGGESGRVGDTGSSEKLRNAPLQHAVVQHHHLCSMCSKPVVSASAMHCTALLCFTVQVILPPTKSHPEIQSLNVQCFHSWENQRKQKLISLEIPNWWERVLSMRKCLSQVSPVLCLAGLAHRGGTSKCGMQTLQWPGYQATRACWDGAHSFSAWCALGLGPGDTGFPVISEGTGVALNRMNVETSNVLLFGNKD